jgi:hypothetical protein
MSTNGQLVFTDVDKITFKGVGNASNAVIDTLTGKIGVGVDSPDANLHVLGNSYVSTNLELGGTLIMGTVNVEAQHSLEAVTATGNTTPLTVEFTNPTTSLVASGNVEVGGDVVLSGNIYNNANLSVQYTTIFPTWTQVGSDIDGEAAGDRFGYSVSMSSDGTRMAIGAPYNDGTASDAGHVRVYAESGGTWTQVGLDIDGEAAYDYSGYSVSMSSDGTRVAIGAPFNALFDRSPDSNAGHVRVYAESGGTWTQVGTDIDGEAAGDSFGQSVSMSSDGTRVAIGARMADDDAGNAVSHVRVYAESGGTWTQVGSDIDGEAAYDYFGWSVSMSSDGTRVAIGAYDNDGTGSSAGHVRVYAESGGTWTQVGSDIDGEAAYDYSGWSVSMSSDGTRVAIGAKYNDGNGSAAGHVRVYDWNGSQWSKVGSDIDGEAAGDESGFSVSISSDGTRVAIGAQSNDGTGDAAGHVRVYSESGGTWTQVGQDIDGESGGVTLPGSPAPSDRSGHSVSISSDGTRVAIGAPYNDGNGGDAGHVRVFDWPMIRSKKILKDDIVEVSGELIVSGNVAVDTDTLFVDSVNDRVGIGTVSPIASLDIDGGPANDIVPALSIRGGLYDTSDLYVLNTYNVNTGAGYAAKVIGVNIKNKVETDNTVQLRNNVGGLTSAGAIYLGSDNADQGVFGVLTCQGSAGTTLTEKFTITDSGNVGIGTTSPQQNLHVHEAGSGQVVIAVTNDTTGSGNNNGIHFGIDSSENGFVWHKPNKQLKFATDNTERMRVDSGTTAVVAGGTAGKGVSFAHAGIAIDRVWSNYPSITVMNENSTGDTKQSQFRLHGCNVSYNSYPSTGGSDFGCSMYIDGTYQVSSDRRFKTNITTIDNALDKVMSLSGKRYQLLNSDGSIRTAVSTNDYKYGFIAQDLEALGLDETFIHYTEEDDGTEGYNKAYSVDYDSFIPLLVNAIKEQNVIINTMRDQLENERSRNDALEARISALENA